MRQEPLCKNFRRSSRQCKLYLPVEEEAMKDSGLILVIKEYEFKGNSQNVAVKCSRLDLYYYTYFTPRFF